ncbi:hypothetical protein [Plantactinospora sp. GCM10030261]|uniref:hypothetical protein n=1 Tax=Plantactinospora sp. GCM10030261 TaxID=3273420 RepID=UPI003607E2DE
MHSFTGILVIRSDDARAHLYPDVTTLLADTGIGAVGDTAHPVEFFDSAGRRLAASFDSTWRLQKLIPAKDEPQPELVLARLATAIRLMEEYLRENQDKVTEAGLDLDQGLARLPRAEAAASLPDMLADCAPLMGHGSEDSRDPWHNFWVHGVI